MLLKASGSQSWHLAQVMNPDVTFCGDESSALFIPQIITSLALRKTAVSRGRIPSTLLRFEAWGPYGASPAQIRHQKSPKPLLFTILGWDWPKLGLRESDLGLFAHRARAELCRKVKKRAGAFAEGWSHLQSSKLCSFLLSSLNCCTETHSTPLATLGKNTSLVKGKEKPKRSLEVVFMQEKEDDLPERLSSTNCLPADGTEQEFHFSPWQFMQASAEQKSFGGMEQPGCCCPHLSTMVAFSPAGWMHSHYAGRKTNPQHCNHLQVQLLFVLLYICLN